MLAVFWHCLLAYWYQPKPLSEVSLLGLLKEENPWGSTEYLRFTRKMMIRIMYICCSWRWMRMNILRITCGSTGIHWREIWTSYASHPISTGPLRHLSLLCFSISGYCVYKDSLVYSSFTFNFIADHVLMSVQTSELCHKITMLFCKFIIGMVQCLCVSLSHTHTHHSACLLLWAQRVGDIDRLLHGWHHSCTES